MWYDTLKYMKKKSGMTTAEISEKSGVPVPTLEKLFSGTTKTPTLPTLSRLVHLFGYTLDDLDEPPDWIKSEIDTETEKSPAPANAETGELTREELIDILMRLRILRSPTDTLSDTDTQFLMHIITLLNDWFTKRG